MANFRQAGSLGDLDRGSSQNATNRNKSIASNLPLGRVLTGIYVAGSLGYPYGTATPSGQVGSFPEWMMVHGVQYVAHGVGASDITNAPNQVGWIKVEHLSYGDNDYYSLPAAGNIVQFSLISFRMALKMQLELAAASDVYWSVGNAGLGVSTGNYAVSGYYEVFSAD